MTNARTFTSMVACVFVSCVILQTAGSAIPMWEFLSRDEKMSYLYKIYSKLVTQYCADSSYPDCTKNMLVTGVRNLANMDDNILDKLDPYQRGAKEMIWRAMVGSSRLSSRVGHEEDYYTTGADHLATSGSETNGLAEESAPARDYVRPSAGHDGPYLVGPMVIRVYPDGRPVPEDAARPLPRDEDAEDLTYPHLPSVEEIEATGDGKLYGKTRRDPKPYRNAAKSYRPRALGGTIDERPARRDNARNHERRYLRVVATDGRPVPYY